MLSEYQRKVIFDAIPNVLCGRTLPKVVTEQYVSAYSIPGIEITYLVYGRRSNWSSSPIRTWYDEDTQTYEEEWGQLHRCTVSIAIVSDNLRDLYCYANDMLRQIFQRRLGLRWSDHRLRFIDVLSSPILPSIRVEQEKKRIFRAFIDVMIEYEVSWRREAPDIRRFDINIGDSTLINVIPGGYTCSIRLVRG